MTKLNYLYLCQRSGRGVDYQYSFVFNESSSTDGLAVVAKGQQNIKVPAGNFDTKWIKIMTKSTDQMLEYETVYLMLFRGRPIVVKKVVELEEYFGGQLHHMSEHRELTHFPKVN